ncbi:MAG: hypothetical protein KN64_07635 [Sulfurovum sp. AS07-7]|nr:MAG: hypothetical protein KN64_07635 [Sulfurovum sp. AS07-7]
MYGLLIFLSLLLLAGCGDGETSNNSSLRTSYFIDAPVKGLNYECGDIKGVTDEKGAFSCSQTPITFKIGSLEIGKIDTFTSDNNVFPQDLIKVPREDVNNEKVVALAQFLQSLEDDGNITEYINITDTQQAFPQVEKFEVLSQSAVAQKLLSLNKSVVPKSKVQSHLSWWVKVKARKDARIMKALTLGDASVVSENDIVDEISRLTDNELNSCNEKINFIFSNGYSPKNIIWSSNKSQTLSSKNTPIFVSKTSSSYNSYGWIGEKSSGVRYSYNGIDLFSTQENNTAHTELKNETIQILNWLFQKDLSSGIYFTPKVKTKLSKI